MKRTKRAQKNIRRRILILCEGQTEKNYFQAIKEDPDYKQQLSAVHPQVVVAKKPSPEQIVQETIILVRKAREEGNAYDKIWVVFDHDHQPHRFSAYEQAVRQGFGIGFSAIAFETWYLLHFERSARGYESAEALLAALAKHYPGYQKARQNGFAYLKGKLQQALENAAWLKDHLAVPEKHTTNFNPWTDVDLLVRELIEA
jgi:hypothetical protein